MISIKNIFKKNEENYTHHEMDFFGRLLIFTR